MALGSVKRNKSKVVAAGKKLMGKVRNINVKVRVDRSVHVEGNDLYHAQACVAKAQYGKTRKERCTHHEYAKTPTAATKKALTALAKILK